MSEEELLEDAEELFEEGKYSKAYPLYSQLLSLHRKNPEYNYKFGACQLFADKRDKKSPIKYLEYAYENLPKDEFPRLHYFMGLAYHQNYQFKDAIGAFKIFKLLGRNRDIKDLKINRKIQMCRNGIDLLSKYRELYVLKKIEVQRQNFYLSYKNEELPGNIIKKPSYLYSRADEKRKAKDVIFFSKIHDFVLLSSYGKRGKTGKDIFIARRDKNGEWKEPERLSPKINTPRNEDYPYLMPDGKTLYFSSTGHNTMGGFDIFKSVYDSTEQKWSNPENINFPFNTPYDDIMFITDTSNTTAYFSSTRSSVNDLIYVYKVGLQRQDSVQNLAAAFQSDSINKEQMIAYIRERAELNVNTTQKTFEKTVQEQKQKDKEQALALQKAQEEKLKPDTNKLTSENVDQLFDEIETINDNIRKLKKNQLRFIKIRDIRTTQVNNINKQQNSIDTQKKDAQELARLKEKLKSEKQIAENLIENYETQIQSLADIEEELNHSAGKLQIRMSDSTIKKNDSLYISANHLVQQAKEIPEKENKHLKDIKQKEKKTRNLANQHYKNYKKLTQTIAQTEEKLNDLKNKYNQTADNNKKQNYQNQINRLKDSLYATKHKASKEQKKWIVHRAKADSLIEKQHSTHQLVAIAQDTSIQVKQRLKQDLSDFIANKDISATDSLYADSETQADWKKDSLFLIKQERKQKLSEANQYLTSLKAQKDKKQTIIDELTKASAFWAQAAQENIRKLDSLQTIRQLKNSPQINPKVKTIKKQAKRDLRRSIVAKTTAKWLDTLIQEDQTAITAISKDIKKLKSAIDKGNAEEVELSFRAIERKVNKVQSANTYFDLHKNQLVQNKLKKSTTLTNKAITIDNNKKQILLDSANLLKKEANDIWKGIQYNDLIAEAKAVNNEQLQQDIDTNNLNWVQKNREQLLRATTAPDTSEVYFDRQYAQKTKEKAEQHLTQKAQKKRQDTIPPAIVSKGSDKIKYKPKKDTASKLSTLNVKTSIASIPDKPEKKQSNKKRKTTVSFLDPNPFTPIAITKKQTPEDNLYVITTKANIIVDPGRFEVSHHFLTKTKTAPEDTMVTDTSSEMRMETNKIASRIDSLNHEYDNLIDTLKQQKHKIYAAIHKNSTQIDRLSANLNNPKIKQDTLLQRKQQFIERTSDKYVLLDLYETISQRIARYQKEKQQNLTLLEQISPQEITLEEIEGLYANIKAPQQYENLILSLAQKAINKSKETANQELAELEDRKSEMQEKTSHYKNLAKQQKEKAGSRWFNSSKEKWNQKASQTLSKADSIQHEIKSLNTKIEFVSNRKSKLERIKTDTVLAQVKTIEQPPIAKTRSRSENDIQKYKKDTQDLSNKYAVLNDKIESVQISSIETSSKDSIKELQPVDMVFLRGRVAEDKAQKAKERAGVMREMANQATTAVKKEEYRNKAQLYEKKADSLKTYSKNLFADVNLRRLQGKEITLPDTTTQIPQMQASMKYAIQHINNRIDSLEKRKAQAEENSKTRKKLSVHINDLKEKRDDARIQYVQTKLLSQLDHYEENNLQLDLKTDSIEIKSFERNLAVREQKKAKENIQKMQDYIRSAKQADDQQEKINYLEDAAKFARIALRQQEKSKQHLKTIEGQPVAQKEDNIKQENSINKTPASDTTAISQTETGQAKGTRQAQETTPDSSKTFARKKIEEKKEEVKKQVSIADTVTFAQKETGESTTEIQQASQKVKGSEITSKKEASKTSTTTDTTNLIAQESQELQEEQEEAKQTRSRQDSIREKKKITGETDIATAKQQSTKDKTEKTTATAQTKSKSTDTTKAVERLKSTPGVETLGIRIDNSENASIHYDEESPIPSVSAKDHSGLIYKVQIAAFRNRVDAEAFRGINPLSTERSENNRWIRYMAGNFANYRNALEARNRLRNLKYRDAFVVAYLNGNRISVSRARDLESQKQPAIAETQTISEQERETAESETVTLGETKPATVSEQPESNSNSTTYFTVQVGVFSQPRRAEQLYNVKDLFNDRLANGYYRYYSGHYASRSTAETARDAIRAKGFSDAFIVPMQNMQRISMQQAVNATQSRAEEDTVEEIKEADETTITFSIQVGAYRDRLNNSLINMFERRSGRNINHYTKENGNHIYTVGSYENITAAREELQKMKKAGFDDAFVIALSGDKRISMDEARRLLNR
ncbi:MAG: SPOR domain-containing protein [Bacteroidales bacterium]|nr:SPOR domain-containing protein [Bacteroidales bacterium]MCF8327265.1 SPOR domain-containing protein [Bacteroidales bacterium]